MITLDPIALRGRLLWQGRQAGAASSGPQFAGPSQSLRGRPEPGHTTHLMLSGPQGTLTKGLLDMVGSAWDPSPSAHELRYGPLHDQDHQVDNAAP